MSNVLDNASIEKTIQEQKELNRQRKRDWLYHHSLCYLFRRLVANHRQKIANKIMAKQLGIKDCSTDTIHKAIMEDMNK